MIRKLFLGVVAFGLTVNSVSAQKRKFNYVKELKSIYFIDSTVKGGIKLIFMSNDPSFDNREKERMVETFYKVYPEQLKIYNPRSRKKVTMFIDTLYDGVAATGGGLIRVNPQWMKKNPEDIDVVTHETMHIIQGYPRYEPIWVTEGIADYVRATLGVNNEAAKWSLPNYKSSQSYTNSYRITARFFIWMEKHIKKGIVKKLDGEMRKGTYTESFWKNETGKTVDELWQEYGKNPTL